jgi:hypothetical protein
MGGTGAGSALGALERALAGRALAETEGKISRDVLMGWGLGQQEARRLQEDWRLRGWAFNDVQRANGLYITPKLVVLLTSQPTQPTLTNCQPTQPTGQPTQPTDLASCGAGSGDPRPTKEDIHA